LSATTSGKPPPRLLLEDARSHACCRLLDKIAKQILVCENRTIKQWDGTISDYKNYLRKKMISAGAV
jgi:hypothetical protein